MEQKNKQFAIIILFFIGLFYFQTVWLPFFNQNSQVLQTKNDQSALKENSNTSEKNTSSTPQTNNGVSTASNLTNSTSQSDIKSATLQSNLPSDEEVKAGEITIETHSIKVVLSPLGGRITYLGLKGYKQSLDRNAGEKNQSDQKRSNEFNIVEHIDTKPYPLGLYLGNENDSRVNYKISSSISPVSDNKNYFNITSSNDPVKFTLTGQLQNGREVTKTLTFDPRSYFIDIQATVSTPNNTDTNQNQDNLVLEWTRSIPSTSPSLLDPYNISAYVWFDGTNVERLNSSSLSQDLFEAFSPGKVQWISITDQYFMSALIAPNQPALMEIIKNSRYYQARLAGDKNSLNFKVFAAPKSYRMLLKQEYQLYRTIDFGKFIGPISSLLLSALHFLFDIFGNYGVAIVALTLLIKMALYPLNLASFKQMRAMQDLAPEMQRIRETVKDRQQQQIEIMSLYKTKGVNPFGGCLPVFIQMPIFIGLFSALSLAVELRHAPFAFWINDLSSPEHLYVAGFGIPVMVIIGALAMLAQQVMTPTNVDASQKRIMYIFPFVFALMLMSCPAGLTLYTLVNTLVSIAQQGAIQKYHSKRAFSITLIVAVAIFSFAVLLAKLGNA